MPAYRFPPPTPRLQRGQPRARGLHRAVPFWPPGGPPRDLVSGLTCTYTGATAPVTTPLGWGLGVSGGTGVNVPSAAFATGDLTVRIVHQPRSWTGAYTALIDKGTGGSARDCSVLVNTNGDLTWGAFGGTSGAPWSVPTGMVPGHVWDFVIVRSGSIVTAFVNGQPLTPTLLQPSTLGAVGDFSLGRNVTTGASHYDGVFLDFQAWSRALSAAEVAALGADPYALVRPRSRLIEFLIPPPVVEPPDDGPAAPPRVRWFPGLRRARAR